ncbi:MAG: hypothetical protein M1812_003755 [Candelaria pacifica]|nr:MAG: hypothetical protein M1812_003755 [Candelaria pacifica]
MNQLTYPLDIHLTLPSTQTFSLASSGTLTYLSLVNPTLIPLHLAAGPHLDVWTNDPETVEWFSQTLLSTDEPSRTDQNGTLDYKEEIKPWWENNHKQSNIGILVRVEQQEATKDPKATSSKGPRITEILFYASLDPAPNSEDELPTPRPSSPPILPTSTTHSSFIKPTTKPELHVHALPLSSDLLYHPSLTTTTTTTDTPIPLSPTPADEEPLNHGEARFLPPLFLEPNPSKAPPRKRARIANLFDDATERRRKASRKGGEGVSKAMANVEEDCKSMGILKARQEKDDTILEKEKRSKSQQLHSVAKAVNERSSSVASTKDPDVIRSTSHKGTTSSGKPPTVSRIASSIDDMRPNREEIAQTTESRNKDFLSRIIMAGMRLYGLQQRKKPNRLQIDNNNTTEEINEYKLIYHQTFKGVCFAFRHHISKTILNQETIRDIVDKFLALYCSDPFPCISLVGDSFGLEKDDISPFGARVERNNIDRGKGNESYSTPSVRRRFRDGEGYSDIGRAGSPLQSRKGLGNSFLSSGEFG